MPKQPALKVQSDPTTRKACRARVSLVGGYPQAGGGYEVGAWYDLALHLPFNLKSPNETTVGQHWGKKHAHTKAWETAIKIAIAEHVGATTVSSLPFVGSALGLSKPAGRMRVSITRLVPSRRHFIQDDDNLRFISKPVNDALKRLGFLVNDNPKFLDQPTPVQAISGDGFHWTVIRLEPALSYEEAGGFEAFSENLLRKVGAIR